MEDFGNFAAGFEQFLVSMAVNADWFLVHYFLAFHFFFFYGVTSGQYVARSNEPHFRLTHPTSLTVPRADRRHDDNYGAKGAAVRHSCRQMIPIV